MSDDDRAGDGAVREAVRSDGGLAGDATEQSGGGIRRRAIGFRTLLRREILRFVRRPRNTFVPPIITNLLYFTVFGVVLGGTIERGGGIDVGYTLFILPGLVVLGMVSNAFENASFSIFHGRWNEYIHEVLTSPLSHVEMVLAYVLASASRGLVVGLIIWGVGRLFTPIPIAHPLYLLAFSIVIPVLFAGFGVVGGLWARDFDYLTVLNQFIIRPLVFFGAVFYPLSALSGIWHTVSLLNPMIYMVNGVRYAIVPEAADVSPNVSLAVLTALTVAIVAVDVVLVRRGYGLVE